MLHLKAWKLYATRNRKDNTFRTEIKTLPWYPEREFMLLHDE